MAKPPEVKPPPEASPPASPPRESLLAAAYHWLAQRPWTATLLVIAAIVVLAGVAYAPVARNGWVWDDASWVHHKRYDRPASYLVEAWTDPLATPQYYPVTASAIWLQHRLWGGAIFRPVLERATQLIETVFGEAPPPEALGFHLMNVALHAVMVSLLYLVLRRLRVPGAIVIALICAVHPIFVESIAWATELKNTLAGVFAMATLWAALRFYRIGDASETSVNKAQHDQFAWPWYPLMGALFFLALFSKTVAVTVAGAILLIAWWQGGQMTRQRAWRRALPMLPLLVIGPMLARITAIFERFRVGALGQDWDFTFIERLLIAGRGAWFYVGKIIWPDPLVFFYPRWQIDANAWWQYLFPVAAAVVVIAIIVLAWRRVIGWGPVVAVLIYGGTLLPASGFFDVYPMRFSFVADHFAYLPSLAMITLLVGSAAWALQRLSMAGRLPNAAQWLAGAAVLLLVAALGAKTFTRCFDYRDYETLMVDTIEKNPGSMQAHINLAGHYKKEGRPDATVRHLRLAIDARPAHPSPYDNLATWESANGNTGHAIELWRQSLARYDGYEPERGVVHQKLALHLKARGEREAAAHHFREAIQCEPRFEPVMSKPVQLFVMAYWYRPVMPGFAQIARAQLGNMHIQAGAYETAVGLYAPVINRGNPRASDYHNLGLAYQGMGRPQNAARAYREALRINPAHLNARFHLAGALGSLNRPREALTQLRHVLEAQPDHFPAHRMAGVIFARLGRPEPAIQHLRRALALAPPRAKPEIQQMLQALQGQGGDAGM